MTAVAVWDHRPSDRELLDARLRRGWTPTPSGLKAGDRVLGYAACIFETPDHPRHSRPRWESLDDGTGGTGAGG